MPKKMLATQLSTLSASSHGGKVFSIEESIGKMAAMGAPSHYAVNVGYTQAWPIVLFIVDFNMVFQLFLGFVLCSFEQMFF